MGCAEVLIIVKSRPIFNQHADQTCRGGVPILAQVCRWLQLKVTLVSEQGQTTEGMKTSAPPPFSALYCLVLASGRNTHREHSDGGQGWCKLVLFLFEKQTKNERLSLSLQMQRGLVNAVGRDRNTCM